jgi:hypothetical protein
MLVEGCPELKAEAQVLCGHTPPGGRAAHNLLCKCDTFARDRDAVTTILGWASLGQSG